MFARQRQRGRSCCSTAGPETVRAVGLIQRQRECIIVRGGVLRIAGRTAEHMRCQLKNDIVDGLLFLRVVLLSADQERSWTLNSVLLSYEFLLA